MMNYVPPETDNQSALEAYITPTPKPRKPRRTGLMRDLKRKVVDQRKLGDTFTSKRAHGLFSPDRRASVDSALHRMVKNGLLTHEGTGIFAVANGQPAANNAASNKIEAANVIDELLDVMARAEPALKRAAKVIRAMEEIRSS